MYTCAETRASSGSVIQFVFSKLVYEQENLAIPSSCKPLSVVPLRYMNGDFYQTLLHYYDTLFPAETEITDFLENEFRYNRTGIVIDAACGTGTYTDALARRGISCVGFDAEPTMISSGRKQRKQGVLTTGFLEEIVSVIESLAPVCSEEPITGLFCIGNSLAHLASLSAVRSFLHDTATILEPSHGERGRIVLQVVNFARFTPGNESIRDLPPLVRPGITMYRNYLRSHSTDTIRFRIILEPEGSPMVSTEIPLLKLEASVLVDALTDAGFTNINIYGGYDRSEYVREQSFLIVLTASVP